MQHDPNDRPQDEKHTEVDPDGQQVPDNQGTGTGEGDDTREKQVQ